MIFYVMIFLLSKLLSASLGLRLGSRRNRDVSPSGDAAADHLIRVAVLRELWQVIA